MISYAELCEAEARAEMDEAEPATPILKAEAGEMGVTLWTGRVIMTVNDSPDLAILPPLQASPDSIMLIAAPLIPVGRPDRDAIFEKGGAL